MCMEIDELRLKSSVASCEQYIVVDNIPEFYKCLDKALGPGWIKRDAVMFTDDGDMVRLLAYKVVGDRVVSILSFYRLDGEIRYAYFDVDVSDVDDVKRVLGEI
ncbi:MAG: hypothetical protein QXT64_01855 [Desulfurococcaceae archaeon]